MDTTTTTTTKPQGSFGVLLSHAFNQEIYGNFPTRLLAAAEGRRVAAAQPGIEFEIMQATTRGWLSADGFGPDEVCRRRWG
ncbi:hypothetical protein [Pseudactinotalea sp. Z1748]|uniref:hypothetical protein n=1 Tax=Pseudactinotalea sp. Z1748 TaxID=3413027 RepID=UPI003C7D233A